MYHKKQFPQDRILNIEIIPVKESRELMSPIEALMRLARVTREEDIGDNGPLIGAITNTGNEGIASLELFQVPFGRDSYDAAIGFEAKYPKLLRSTIKFHAENQGTTYSKFSEEEPGRIIHQYQGGVEVATPQNRTEDESASWDWPYYGEVDATPKHISAIRKQFAKEGINFLEETYIGKDRQEHKIEHSLKAATEMFVSRYE